MTVTRRLLWQVTLGTGLVLAVMTSVTYDRIYSDMEERELRTVRTYVSERVQREEGRFLQVQSNMLLVRGQFLKRLGAESPPGFLQRWDHWYRLYDDHAWRSREAFKDARSYASMWAHRDWRDTPEARRQVLIAQELCDEMLPGWVDVFPSFYFQFHGPLNIGVDTSVPDWAWGMPADYEWKTPEWMQLALPEHPPNENIFSWTGLLKDEYTPIAFVCVYLPIYHQGQFLGSVGHNMSMEGTLDGATRREIPGASHFIFRQDGRLVAHPTLRQEILDHHGLLLAQDCGDDAIASLYKIAISHQNAVGSGYDPVSESHYSFARLSGPGWYYMTTVSRAHLQQKAYLSARWVLWSGLASLAALLALAAVILRRQIGRPLAELSRITDAMSAGDLQVRAQIQREDDLGSLARSFNRMVEQVSAREDDLRQLNAHLEQRVNDRTYELSLALERERELGEMKTNFISLVSHEFRTPLGVILSAAEVLQRYFERLSPEKRARHLEMIAKSTKNLAKLIEEVLLLGRVEEGRLSFTPIILDLEKSCRHLIDEIRSATGGICPIRFLVPETLPLAWTDEAVLRHILTNLLSNACKYSEPDSAVVLELRRHGPDAVLVVRDNGIGIPVEDQERLFTSFSRASNVGQRPGTGLGLVVVKRCVVLHGGELSLASAPGQGTTVTVRLPVFASVEPNPKGLFPADLPTS
jgi:signal transduction histidine kinase